jgi:hypothetical protein
MRFAGNLLFTGKKKFAPWQFAIQIKAVIFSYVIILQESFREVEF